MDITGGVFTLGAKVVTCVGFTHTVGGTFNGNTGTVSSGGNVTVNTATHTYNTYTLEMISGSNPALHHLDHYVACKMLTDATAEIEPLLAEYCTRFYGPAAKPMRWRSTAFRRFWRGSFESADSEITKTTGPISPSLPSMPKAASVAR